MDTRTMSGTYRGRAREGGLSETASGKEQVALLMEVTEGDAKGIRMTWFGPFTEKTFESTMKALRACGWKGTDPSDLLVENFKNTGLGDNDVDLVIEQEPDMETDAQGQLVQKYDEAGNALTRARIRWVNSVGRVAIKTALSVDKAKIFAARIKQQIAAFDAKNKGPKTNGAPGREEPPPPTDIDAPPF